MWDPRISTFSFHSFSGGISAAIQVQQLHSSSRALNKHRLNIKSKNIHLPFVLTILLSNLFYSGWIKQFHTLFKLGCECLLQITLLNFLNPLFQQGLRVTHGTFVTELTIAPLLTAAEFQNRCLGSLRVLIASRNAPRFFHFQFHK